MRGWIDSFANVLIYGSDTPCPGRMECLKVLKVSQYVGAGPKPVTRRWCVSIDDDGADGLQRAYYTCKSQE